MASIISIGSTSISRIAFTKPIQIKNNTRKRTKISCIGWDPEGILGKPQTGHISRLEFRRRLERDAQAGEEFQRQIREEKDRRRKLRQSRVIPDGSEELMEYFLDTEAQDIEFEIARLRPRLIELEALEKALQEGTEAYDKMQVELVTAKESLTKIFTSKDVKATLEKMYLVQLLELVERNEINRSLLTLLDENIASARQENQKQAAAYMEKIRTAVVNC
ncbi:hypothetical protein RJ641_001100 [Dillenia turbinata]|uniref:Uncharacterized protein n=1 Tax=Dillenia turbinata TaxID=194707 RepID=A0AAN8ZS39_9MAGN